MLPIEVREQMEAEFTWRKQEMIFLRNILGEINKEENQDKYRKSLVVMLYSHFEGFCKTSLLIYVNYINSLNLKRKEVNENLRAASMNNIFKKYDNPDRKCDIFRTTLPDDTSIHKEFRKVDFIIQFNEFLEDINKLDDDVINTESNLKFTILQKNLYRLGIDYVEFKSFEKDINQLVNLRNSIAHGSEKMGIKKHLYDKLENSVFNTMNNLILIINKIVLEERFKSSV